MASRVEREGFAPAGMSEETGLNQEDIGATMDEAERRAEEAVRGAKQRLAGVYERTSRVATKAYQDALDFAYEKPAMAALVTFGAGLTMGYMLSNGKSRNYKGRIVPAIATALAEAVHEVFDA
jgi:ElaB/YqjD/DUF883 family membrane-anchored ribosome-binding protein